MCSSVCGSSPPSRSEAPGRAGRARAATRARGRELPSAGAARSLPPGADPRRRRGRRRPRPPARRSAGRGSSRRAPRRPTSSACWSGSPASSAISSSVGSRASCVQRWRSARCIFCMRSTTWTGTRIVRALSAIARATAWRIHHVAYVENLRPALPLELLDGADEAEHAFLDEVEEGEALVAVVLRDRDDEAEVALDHPPLGLHVAPLDPLGELDLVGGGQERVAPDLPQEELEASVVVSRTSVARGGAVGSCGGSFGSTTSIFSSWWASSRGGPGRWHRPRPRPRRSPPPRPSRGAGRSLRVGGRDVALALQDGKACRSATNTSQTCRSRAVLTLPKRVASQTLRVPGSQAPGAGFSAIGTERRAARPGRRPLGLSVMRPFAGLPRQRTRMGVMSSWSPDRPKPPRALGSPIFHRRPWKPRPISMPRSSMLLEPVDPNERFRARRRQARRKANHPAHLAACRRHLGGGGSHARRTLSSAMPGRELRAATSRPRSRPLPPAPPKPEPRPLPRRRSEASTSRWPSPPSTASSTSIWPSPARA